MLHSSKLYLCKFFDLKKGGGALAAPRESKNPHEHRCDRAPSWRPQRTHLRSIANPAQLWLTGMISSVLMLMCGGWFISQNTVSAMSSGCTGSAPA